MKYVLFQFTNIEYEAVNRPLYVRQDLPEDKLAIALKSYVNDFVNVAFDFEPITYIDGNQVLYNEFQPYDYEACTYINDHSNFPTNKVYIQLDYPKTGVILVEVPDQFDIQKPYDYYDKQTIEQFCIERLDEVIPLTITLNEKV